MSKYGEPWKVCRDDRDDPVFYYLCDRHGDYCCGDLQGFYAERIVSCVNALAGIDCPEKLPALLEAIRSSGEWVAQQESHDSIFYTKARSFDVVSAAYAALFKTEGEPDAV